MNAWGIDDGYHDIRGRWFPTEPNTRAAIMRAMGADEHALPPDPPVRVVRQDTPLPFGAQLRLEDGRQVHVGPGVHGLPLGYHTATLDSGRTISLIVAPASCHFPENLKSWGVAAQLYSLRSEQTWGMGDLGDLARLANWVQRGGGDYVLLCPLGATPPGLPQEPSPYYAASRLWRNPLYLRVEDVPGAQAIGSRLDEAAAAGRALNASHVVDRDAVYRIKMAALEAIYAVSPAGPALDAYRAEGGVWLERFATWCALAERHGQSWYDWPVELRRHDSPAVAAFAADNADRVRFHAWLQWAIDRQLAAVTGAGLMHDLPIGFNSGGADGWVFQDYLAKGMSVGAPPDELAPGGQDWGLPPFVPHRLQAACYEPFIATIRQGMRHAWGLRIDHVMGLFRLFWCPEGLGARHGAYVRYPADDLLGILALESVRAKAVVVGEDLGTVEPGVRETLARERVLSYKLAYFEPVRPARYPQLAMAAITTHDLATLAGIWTGQDEVDQRAVGLEPYTAGADEIRDRLSQVADVPLGGPVDELVKRAHVALAEAPSALICATLEDLTASPDRPNLPGTTRERPNWSLAQRTSLEGLETHPLAAAVAAALARE